MGSEERRFFLSEGEAPLDRLNQLAALLQAGQYEAVEGQALALVSEYPLAGGAWLVLGVSLESQGKPSLAALNRAARLEPDNAVALCNLGAAEQRQGQTAKALERYRRALKFDPNLAIAHYNMGLGLRIVGSKEEAMEAFRCAIAVQPDYFDAYFQLGLLEQELGHLQAAVDTYQKAIAFRADSHMIFYNLGLGLRSLGRPEAAIEQYEKALRLRPDLPDVLNNMAMAYRDMGQVEAAIGCCRRALEIDPIHYHANLHLNLIYMDQKRLVESEQLCRKVLEAKPDFAEMRQNLARALAYMSDFGDVVSESDRAFLDKPDQVVIWEQRLYCYSYHPDLSAETIFQEFVRWGDRFPDPTTDFSAHDRNPNRRLRIGYVSPDFRAHSSRFYFWPLFCHHDKAAFELFAYSNVEKEVAWTRLFRGQFEHWRDIRGVDDEAVVNLVREDGIDILVDLCGHMQDERLGVFARKPAPIQATWLGSAWTTGLKTIDYALFDPFVAPEGTLTREAIHRLPHSFMVFQPPLETADIVPPPCLKNGHITFGYTGRSERLNHRTFRVWGEILKRLPDARLILDYASFADPMTQGRFRDLLVKHGVDTDRVTMRRSPKVFPGLNDIDILLDSFPHGGGTMLMDALWMGVPFVTLASRPPVGRLGLGMLMNLGLPEWVAATEAEYIDKACHFAGEALTLKDLRLGMRERMRNSPLMDGPGFARAFEAAYRTMFERWTKEVPPGQRTHPD
ncbi:O-linked N-acetylglucosamine transferase, SPINDLY family protein [Geothrix sp.]|uniref:O-linked N-acetylglucosamine transferase, SPINDLY family protein n=2 Tax=Geothrix sp. TaxID=1962974 RepID=UPI002637AF7A|nr:glycosyltransferase family 41 protein [Geothrix sp.]WIL20852.1 MAG: tetratricopeptide repeat protein [Geothrix sp.]